VQEAYSVLYLPKDRSGFREMFRTKLLEGSEGDEGFTARSSLHAVAQEVEAAAHAWAQTQPGGDPQDRHYQTKCRALVFNLKKNEALRGQVRRREVSGEELARMDKDELADASKLAERQKLAKMLEDEVALDYGRRADVIATKRKVK
jgi:hypothetical protein